MKKLIAGSARSKAAGLAIISAIIVMALAPRQTRATGADLQGQEERYQPSETSFTLYAALDVATLGPVGTAQNLGDLVVVDGNLYSDGHGMEGRTAGNDPNMPGAIGRIHCRAAVINPSLTVPYGTFVSELYAFPDNVTNLLADGLGPNFGFTSHRIVSGGTGKFVGMIGSIEEKEIGFNKTGGCNLRVKFSLVNAGASAHGR